MENKLDSVAKKAGFWYIIGNLLLKGCIFFSLPIFTRILSTSDFGIYNTYIAYEGIITAILGLGLYGTVKNAKLDFKEKFDEYLSSVLFLSIIFFGFILLITNICYEYIKTIFEFNRIIVNILLFQSFGSYLIYFYGAKLNIEFKYKSYIIISFLNTIGNIGLSILLILFVFPNIRYLGRILGSAIPLIMLAIFIVLSILVKGKKIISKKYWKYALLIGLPLVPHVVSQSLLSQLDRIMINTMVGSSESGIYSFNYTICTITYIIATSLDNAWSPWVYMNLKDNKNKEIKEKSKNYIILFAIITLGFICVIPEVIKIIANKEYWVGLNLLIPLCLSNLFIFLYMLPVNIEYYNKKTFFISIGTVTAAIINLALNYFAIILVGYKGAAYTTLISYMQLFIFHWYISRKYNIDSIYDIKFILKVLLALFVVVLSILILSNYFIGMIYRYVIILILLAILYKNKSIFIDMLKRKGN